LKFSQQLGYQQEFFEQMNGGALSQDTKNIVIGVGVTAAIIFMLFGCGSERDYYCVQWEGPGNCLEYETDY